MSGFTAIDLSKLPAPEVIRTPDYDALLAQMKAEAIRRLPELEAYLSLESEPVTQLLRVCAWYRMLDHLEFNDRARACLLAQATGADLDQLAAFWGVARLVVQEADTSAAPPIAAIGESDAGFRARIQLSLEGHSTAGPRGAYIFWARSASGQVKDAGVTSPAPGEVVVSVLSHEGDGTPSEALLSAVDGVLNDADVRPLTDHVTVQAARVIPYEVAARLILYEGPDASAVTAAAEGALARYIETHHRLGHDITRSGLHAALHQPGVQNVVLAAPAADIGVGPGAAAYCAPDARSVSLGGRNV